MSNSLEERAAKVADEWLDEIPPNIQDGLLDNSGKVTPLGLATFAIISNADPHVADHYYWKVIANAKFR
ncbi:hypothetical protein ACFL2V_09250 [Pseudomonadota bacterium]